MRRHRGGGRRGPRIFLAVFLIAAGTLLFLGNFGLLPIHTLWDLIPVGLIMFGLIRLLDSSRMSGRIFGGLLLVFGAVFLLVHLGVLHVRARDGSWPLSILFIIFGIGLLMRVLESGHEQRPLRRWRDPAAGETINSLDDVAMFAAVKRKLDTPDFQGGEIRTFFGEVKLDLRKAGIASSQESVVVDAAAVFGAIKLRVPDTWRVTVNGAGILGAFEDKTIPPNQTAGGPHLVITGLSIFGSVEIEN